SPGRKALLSGVAQTQSHVDGAVHNALAEYNTLLVDYPRAESIYKVVKKARYKDQIPMTALHPEQGLEEVYKANLINDEEYQFMVDFESRVFKMISVDDFAFDEITLGR